MLKHFSTTLAWLIFCVNHVALVTSSATSSFVATITPLGADDTVTGTAVVFAEGSKIAFAGLLSSAPPDLDATMCDATNGCGVHVHAGMACTNSTTQEGHYYNADALDIDPWLDIRYSSDGDGAASFSGILDVGETATLEGRAFLVHAEDGSRIGCGILTPTTTSPLIAHTSPLNASNVFGHATLVPIEEAVCFYGIASGLDASLTSFLTDEDSPNCTATNGCGVHIHSGTGCTPADAQGGHYYDTTISLDDDESEAVDPWLLVGYTSTDATGNTEYVQCVPTPNATAYADRPFIVHANDGSRVSCGILEVEEEEEDEDDGHDSHDHHDHDDEDKESAAHGGSLLVLTTISALGGLLLTV